MSEINSAHKKAMDLAETAWVLQRSGKKDDAVSLFGRAFALEREAAMTLSNSAEQPSRSILFRSAASLALRANLIQQAEQMVCYGLIGDPPEDIAEELRDLLEQVHFLRHLELRGVALSDDEIQMSLVGPEVGFGFVRSEEFLNRLRILELLSYRTVERLRGLSFRSHGQVPKSLRGTYQPYMSVPRAASFAVTIRFGIRDRNLELFPQYSIEPSDIVREIVTNLEMINAHDEHGLRERFADSDYYENFLYLTKKISPDTQNVSLVGITSVQGEETKTTAFTRTRREIRVSHPSPTEAGDYEAGTDVEVTGRLTFAKAPARGDRGRVQLTTESGDRFELVVPHSALNDLVRPYWEEIVTIEGRQVDDKIYFSDIKAE